MSAMRGDVIKPVKIIDFIYFKSKKTLEIEPDKTIAIVQDLSVPHKTQFAVKESRIQYVVSKKEGGEYSVGCFI